MAGARKDLTATGLGILVTRFQFPCRSLRGMHLGNRQENQLVQDKTRKNKKKEALPMSFMSDQYSNAGTLHEMWRSGAILFNADLPLLRGYRVTIHEVGELLFLLPGESAECWYAAGKSPEPGEESENSCIGWL